MLNISGLKLPMIGDMLVGGNVYFVDSGSGVTNNENNGLHPTKSPLATIFGSTGAFSKCTADNGDFIVAMPGHAETLTTSGACNIAGVTLVGIGNGDNQPAITVNAAVYGLNFTADDIKVHGIRVLAGSSVTAASRFARVAASDIEISKCRFELGYNMSHVIAIISGDNVKVLDSEFSNTVDGDASDLSPQKAILNIAGTNVLVKGCRFKDIGASKTARWRMCVAGGALNSSIVVEDCAFVCRGQATSTRSAGASDGTAKSSPTIATLFCRAISPSANTAVGTIFNMKYGYQIECYDVAAVNKKAVISPTMA